MSDASTPQAGWYADPEDPQGERWWNGTTWSDHKRPATADGDAPPAAANPKFTVAPLAPTLGGRAKKKAETATTPAVPVPPVASVAPAASVEATPAAPAEAQSGFTFGGTTPAGVVPRPDPYGANPAYTPPGSTTPYYSPYVAAPYGAPAYGSGINGLALGGLIASAAGWFIIPIIGSIAGIILSAFGLRTARQRELAGNPNTGRGLAMAGLIIGIIITAGTLLFWVIIIAALMTPTTYY